MNLQLPNKTQLVIGLVLLALGAVAGYTLAPTKVEVREKIVEKKVSDTERTRDREVVRVKEKRPDGTETVRTEFRDKTKEKQKTEENTSRESEKIVVRGTGLGVRLMAKGPTSDWTYGVGVDKKVLGPISLGVFGFTDKTYGVSVGVEF